MAKLKWKTSPTKIVNDIRKGVQNVLPSVLKSAILTDISKGVSPVFSRKWLKYSKSYKEVIDGKAMYFTKGGKVIRVPAKTKGKGRMRFYQPNMGTKSKSLVNMNLSGDLVKSFDVTPSGKGLKLKFSDKKASYHNDGTKNIPRRPLLPTQSGEKFNNRITNTSQRLIKKIAAIVFKRS